MLNLYWQEGGETRNQVPKAFQSEQDLERYIFDHQDILGGDIRIFHRQIRMGDRTGILDMLGIDQSGQICVVEVKNAEIGDEVLTQITGYLLWAETNPEAIKNIWLELKDRPEDVAPDWDNLKLRGIVVAPGFRPTVARLRSRINYQIDLIEFQRFCYENSEFILVETIEEKEPPKVGVVTSKGKWDWSYYEQEHGKEATAQFRAATAQLEAIAKQQGWQLTTGLNKYYLGFKLGNRVVFSVVWGGAYAWNVHLKVPEASASKFKAKGWEMLRYDSDFHEAIFRPSDRKSAQLDELKPIMIMAYNHISGED